MTHRAYDISVKTGMLLLLVVGLWHVSPAMGAPPSTGETRPITGHNPYATGTIGILGPDMVALPPAGIYIVDHTKKPSDFKPDLTGLTPLDDDGDDDGLGGPPAIGNQAFNLQTWTWKRVSDGRVLSITEQEQAFSTVAGNVNGTLYTVSAQIPVELKTQNGDPRLAVDTKTTSQYSVQVKVPVLPTLQVNGKNFTLAEATAGGFPQTGFVGANFQFYMNGTNTTSNANYTYSTNQSAGNPWITIDNTGTVRMTRMPTTAAEKSVTITISSSVSGTDSVTYAFEAKMWFVNNGASMLTAAATDIYCDGLGNGYATPGYATLTNASYSSFGTRTPFGTLWGDWGNVGFFGSNWDGDYYWASEPNEIGRYVVGISNRGFLASGGPFGELYVVCSRTL